MAFFELEQLGLRYIICLNLLFAAKCQILISYGMVKKYSTKIIAYMTYVAVQSAFCIKRHLAVFLKVYFSTIK